MHFRSLFLSAFLFVAAPGLAHAQDATGVWRTEATNEGYLEVGIASCGQALCGTILRARDCAGSEQPYPHTGRRMIWDMVAKGPAKWAGGKIWDPRNDRTFNSSMELAGSSLSVSGCVLGICQKQTWRRAG